MEIVMRPCSIPARAERLYLRELGKRHNDYRKVFEEVENEEDTLRNRP